MAGDDASTVKAVAKAAEETAKFGSKVVDAGTGLAAYMNRVVGQPLEDAVGYYLADHIKHKRLRREADLCAETMEHLRRWGVDMDKLVDVSPSVLLPLMAAAVDEDRDVLKDLWAKLLASAMDPARTTLVRPSLIELLKQLDPLDARALIEIKKLGGAGSSSGNFPEFFSQRLGVTQDEGYFSLQHLHALGCIGSDPTTTTPNLTAKGRLLLKAVSD
jgi:abortive infection alpha-like protein